MNLLTIKQMKKSYTDKILLDGADFSMEEGEKVGIIGINGTGKSTLLKIIAGLEEVDEGDYVKGNKVYIKYLPQNPDVEQEKNVMDYVIAANRNEENAGSIEGRAKSILQKLGFDDYGISTSILSGGQKKKAALAGALLAPCDILILDEPTNHLDSEMIEWLEEYLRAYKGALIMVTHDRYFLDLVCNRIVEIDRGKLYSYNSNYEGYLELKAQRQDMALATQRKHASILKKEIAWMQRGARARATKQKAHIQRYEALRDEKQVEADGNVEITALSSRLGKTTIELNAITKAYGENFLIRDFTYVFLRNDRIGIVGKNGCGKTTLLKLITGAKAPDSGMVEIGETVRIGYFAQENSILDDSLRVIDYIKETGEYIQTSEGTISASQMLETFLFDATLQYAKIGKLSGGEKRRLYLLGVLMQSPNVLLLDEPTNDLDVQTLCILEDYLDTFPGILIVISHDRYFLDRVARHLLTFEENGTIRRFEGTYTEYFQVKQNADNVVLKPKEVPAANARSNEKPRTHKVKFSYQEQREYDTIEQDIADLEERISELEAAILQAATDFMKLNELTKVKGQAEQELEEKLERYIYLEEKAELIKTYPFMHLS